MKSASPKTIFSSRTLFANSKTPHTISQFSHFSTSLTQFHSSSHSSSSSYPSRRHEEESRHVRVSVWWDFENCSLPAGTHVSRLSQSITAAVRANSIKGPITITAFGDITQLSRPNQEVLSATGINLTHVPNGGKNSADRSLLVDLMYWVSQNPPPAHLFLISGDRDFANILHRLRLNNYNILLASPGNAPVVLCSAASIMWQWNALLRGENLIGKHFNQPPDGPYNSWYGHYKVPLVDPFAVSEQSACSLAEDPSELGSVPNKFRPVPKAVVKQIRHVLNSYPEGISITDLRSELGKTNVSLDKDLYGYKKFSRFLLSMPHILKIQSLGDGQLSIISVASKVPDPVEDNPDINNGYIDQAVSAKRNSGAYSSTGLEEKKPSSHLSQKINLKESPKQGQEPLRKVPDHPLPLVEKGNLSQLRASPKAMEEISRKVPEQPPLVEKGNNAELVGGPMSKLPESLEAVEELLKKVPERPPLVETTANDAEVTMSQDGFFKRIWRIWVGPEDNNNISEENNSAKKIEETKKNCLELTGQCADPTGQTSDSSTANGSFKDKNVGRISESNDEISSRSPGFFKGMVRWCKFWSSQKSDNSSEVTCDAMSTIKGDNKEESIFSMESFWNDMVAFLDTPKGSDAIVQSQTRKEMAQNLQKHGPSTLRNLVENDVLHLVDLLITDRKWVEEYPSEKFPFKLIRPAERGSLEKTSNSNGLRSIFLDTTSLSESQKLPGPNEKRCQNHPHTGVSPHEITKNPSRSRSDVLADCQKFVDYIVKEHPEGFNLGHFRKLFFERYNYSLDVRKLGHQKLVSVLQLMPGVKIESNYLMSELPPSKVQRSSSGQETESRVQQSNFSNMMASSSDSDDDLDSSWEELGPIADTRPKRNEKERPSMIVKEENTVGQVNHEYQSLSDDDFSDSDEESLASGGSELGKEKRQVKEVDSSLLQILDSWYDNKKYHNSNNNNSKSRTSCESEALVGSYGPKQRTPKTYSFVADQNGDGTDKLVDGILGSLKTSGERPA